MIIRHYEPKKHKYSEIGRSVKFVPSCSNRLICKVIRETTPKGKFLNKYINLLELSQQPSLLDSGFIYALIQHGGLGLINFTFLAYLKQITGHTKNFRVLETDFFL